MTNKIKQNTRQNIYRKGKEGPSKQEQQSSVYQQTF